MSRVKGFIGKGFNENKGKKEDIYHSVLEISFY